MTGKKTHYFFTDLYRAFFGKRFLISIAGVVLALLFSLQGAESMSVSVLYVFLLATYGVGAELSLVFGAFCYGTSFAEELENGYAKYSVIRGNVGKYVGSKLVVIFLSSVAVMTVACGVFPLICLLFGLPWSDVDTLQQYAVVSYRGLLENGHYLLWFLLYGGQWGIFVGCMSVAAAFFSLYVSNRLLVLAVPILLSQVMTDLGEGIRVRLPYLDPSLIFSARYRMLPEDWLVMGWALLVAAVFCSVIGVGCVRKIRKRL